MGSLRRTLLCCTLVCLVAPICHAASYRRALTIANPGSALTNFQVPVVLTPGNFNYANVDPGGAIVRFTDSDQSTALAYYREGWSYGGTSVFWILVPSIPAGSSKTVYLYHSTTLGDFTPTPSNFPATFPGAYVVSAGTVVASPTGGADPWESAPWFEVRPGATIKLAGPSYPIAPFTVKARRAIVGGTIDASGVGYAPSAGTNVPGGGPGAGGAPLFDGAGGAGHGGVGGAGGGAFPASGGPAYGSTNLVDAVDVGSSGGNGSAVDGHGGHGGGAVRITAQWLDVVGTVTADGANAVNAGGGGSGGAVVLKANELRVTGTLSARGGAGGECVGGCFASGGGGAGGRIKLFGEASISGSPTLLVGGGASGSGNGPGQPGAAGTVYSGVPPAPEPDHLVALVGSEVALAVESPRPGAMFVGSPSPNPSHGPVTLRIELARQAPCTVEITDLQGRLVKTLARGDILSPGSRDWVLDVHDERGRVVPGVYLAHVIADGQRWTRRFVMVR